MPSLAELTDGYSVPQTLDSLPVEQPYLGVPADPDGMRRVYITKSNVAPDLSKSITDNRPEPRPEPGYTDEEYFSKPFAPMPELPEGNMIEKIIKKFANTEFSKGHPLANQLFGTGGEERYQLWPERMVREGIAAPGEVAAGKVPRYAIDPETGDVHTSPEMIEKALAVSALAGSGGLGGVTDATLGSAPFLRPALKYKDRLYKGKEGQQHLDVIPADLYPTFQQKAMSGEDIKDFNFGFINDKGKFLSRQDALEYGINTGLIDPQAGKYGALTSTLMADSSKPGVAIESMKTYPLAKPTDRWSNTLGQNDNLIQNMSPDEFLNKSRPLKIDAESRETINSLKQRESLDPLELQANGKEDGRHRAIAAKELGIKEVPVINHRNIDWDLVKVAENKLTGEAAKAIDNWVGGDKDFIANGGQFGVWHPKKLKEAITNPELKIQLDEAMAPIKADLKAKYGDTITLYRNHGDLPKDAKSDRELLSFTSDKDFAENGFGAPKKKELINEAEIKSKEAEFEKTGKVQIDKNTWLEKKTDTIYPQAGPNEGKPVEVTYIAIMRPDGIVTDTDSVRAYLKDINSDRTASNAVRDKKLKNVVTKQIPIDDIVFATDRFNQKEFIVHNKNKTLFSGTVLSSGYQLIPVDHNPFEDKK